MEFKFRAVDDRPSSSERTIPGPHSSYLLFQFQEDEFNSLFLTKVDLFCLFVFQTGPSVVPTWALSMPPPCPFPNSYSRTSPDPNPDSITIHDPILNPTNAHDAIQRQMEKDRIREEILAAEIARRRVLEAEVRRELMLEREIAMQRAACQWLGLHDPFGPMPFHPILPQAHSFDHRFAFTSPLPMVPRLPEPVPLIALVSHLHF